MTLCVDTSALLELYGDEDDSDTAVELVGSDPALITSWVTVAEARRNLSRSLGFTVLGV